MEQDTLPYAIDRDIFERVWRRVMPEPRPDSPIALLGEASHYAALPALTTPPSPAPTASLPSLPLCAPAAHLPCLGAASASYSGQLQAYIAAALSAWQRYLALARRTTGIGGKVLADLAAEEYHSAKRLSTAYFLISGVRYWPARRPASQHPDPLHATLRHCFGAEQQSQCTYQLASIAACDAALKSLFVELAEREGTHANLLRGLLEQL